ncbi:hypothetical protein CL689_00350, partial [Candidatus Saccharibacteria bacterium]|nr:hypothetical protein [Candidatus Saccharibacteria bacterium]
APTVIRRKDATNLTFGFTLSLPRKLDNEELDAMQTLNHILTGTTHSRIFGKARAKGLAYSVGSYTGCGFYDSAWDLSGQVNHETAPQLFDIIARELKAVLDGKITDEEIEAAKSFTLGRYQMGAQTVSQIAGFYTHRYFADDYIYDYSKVPDSIRKVSRDKIISTAKSFIDANTWVLAAVSNGDREELIDLSERLTSIFDRVE